MNYVIYPHKYPIRQVLLYSHSVGRISYFVQGYTAFDNIYCVMYNVVFHLKLPKNHSRGRYFNLPLAEKAAVLRSPLMCFRARQLSSKGAGGLSQHSHSELSILNHFPILSTNPTLIVSFIWQYHTELQKDFSVLPLALFHLYVVNYLINSHLK